MPREQAGELEALLRGGPRAVDMDLREQRVSGEHQEDLTSEPAAVAYEAVPELGGLSLAPEHPFPAAGRDMTGL